MCFLNNHIFELNLRKLEILNQREISNMWFNTLYRLLSIKYVIMYNNQIMWLLSCPLFWFCIKMDLAAQATRKKTGMGILLCLLWLMGTITLFVCLKYSYEPFSFVLEISMGLLSARQNNRLNSRNKKEKCGLYRRKPIDKTTIPINM